MIRAVMLLGIGVALGWGVSVVEVDGKPLAVHAQRIWKSPLVQTQVQKLSKQVPQAASQLLGEASKALPPGEPPSKRKDAAERGKKPNEEHSEADRRALDALVDRARHD